MGIRRSFYRLSGAKVPSLALDAHGAPARAARRQDHSDRHERLRKDTAGLDI